MDASFDAYGSGWGDETADRSMLTTQRKAEFDKVPVPVTVKDLKLVEPGEENYVIGSHKFNTVRIVGRVLSHEMKENGTAVEYEITDTDDISCCDRFAVLHYYDIDVSVF